MTPPFLYTGEREMRKNTRKLIIQKYSKMTYNSCGIYVAEYHLRSVCTILFAERGY